MGAAAVLRRNLLIYGLGGIIAPFVGIKLIDLRHRRPGGALTCGAGSSPACSSRLVLVPCWPGVVYPLAVWAVGQVAFRHQADGSFVSVDGKVVGSSLIGQNFTDKDGNPCPSTSSPDRRRRRRATTPRASGGTNLGPSNPN